MARKAAGLRLTVTLLLVLNVTVLGYIVLAPDMESGAAARIEALEINAQRIRVLGAANRGPGQRGAPQSEKSAGLAACLEWGPFAASDTSKVESALAQLGLAGAVTRRDLSEASGEKRYAYLVREPDSAVVARIAELRRAFPETEIRAAPCPR